MANSPITEPHDQLQPACAHDDLILAPTVLIGLLLSIFFVVHRYNDLQRQLEDGASIIEPLAVSSEYGMTCKTASPLGS
jgi:two-component system sensor histidine kinase BarA